MKRVIDIPDESYKNIKNQVDKRDYPNMQIGRAIVEGTPLTEVFENIKAEILDLDYLVDSAKYSDSETRCHNVDYLVSEILKIIDRHISEEGSKENEESD